MNLKALIISIKGTKLSRKEIKASKVIGKLLVKNKIYFAGIDFVQEKLIGDINITSPTGLVAYKNLSGVPVAKNKFPAVLKTPPKFLSPKIFPELVFLDPNGIDQFIFPVLISIAFIFPHGGVDAGNLSLSKNNCHEPHSLSKLYFFKISSCSLK